MGKTLYEQFIRETIKSGYDLSWEDLPLIAQDAWNNVWITSRQVCKLVVSEAFTEGQGSVTENEILDLLDNIIYWTT